MTPKEQRAAAKKISVEWKTHGYEKGETQPFRLGWLRMLPCVSSSDQFIQFEHQVQFGHTSFSCAGIPFARVIIEQKNKDVELNRAKKTIRWFQPDPQVTKMIKKGQRTALKG